MQCSRMSARCSIAPAGARPATRAFRPAAAAPRPLAGPQRHATASASDKWRQWAAPEGSAAESGSAAAADAQAGEPETVFYEGSGSNAELAVSLLLSVFILTIPLTIASIGRRLWIKYKFTNKRLIVTTDSPILKREVQIEYSKIREIRAAPRAFGAWGDVVFFLDDGSRLPLAGLERFDEIVAYIERCRERL